MEDTTYNSHLNIEKAFFETTNLEEGLIILSHKNESTKSRLLLKDVKLDYVQFHFCIKGHASFFFNKNYSRNISEEKSLLLYNPNQKTPIHLVIAKQSWVVSVLIAIKKMHHFFSEEVSYISLLNRDEKHKKYYKEDIISPAMSIVLNQLVSYHMSAFTKLLYFRGKAYELLSLYFNNIENDVLDQCPFLTNEEHIAKIKVAKDYLISNIDTPPSLHELSEHVGLNLKKLKAGFKDVYGYSVFQFLFHYKMELARKLLESSKSNVTEVGFKIGYSTSSHFISAFKKKYGITPKKYIMSLKR